MPLGIAVQAQVSRATVTRALVVTSASAPTVNDDADDGYYVGQVWITNAGVVYTLTNSTVGAAVWSTPAAGGGATWTEYEIDFGAKPVSDARFTVTDATVGAASKVAVVPSGKAATGRTADDWQADSIIFAALPAAGSFTLFAHCPGGPIVGPRKIQYQVA